MTDIAVLVPSFDGYADIWPIQAELFQRFWPDRTWPMYWVHTRKPVPSIANGIAVPEVGRLEWGNAIRYAVECVPASLIAFWFEEIFPLSKVPNDLFLEAAEIMRTTPDVGIVQLTRYYCQPTNPSIGNFADYPLGEVGFSSSLPAIFRKEVLLHLLKANPKSNDFEQQSSAVMFRDLPGVRSLISTKPMFKLCDNALLSGPWRKCAVDHLTELGIDVNFSIRGICPNECDYPDGVKA